MCRQIKGGKESVKRGHYGKFSLCGWNDLLQIAESIGVEMIGSGGRGQEGNDLGKWKKTRKKRIYSRNCCGKLFGFFVALLWLWRSADCQVRTWLSARHAPSVGESSPAGPGFVSAWTSVLSRHNASSYRPRPRPQGRHHRQHHHGHLYGQMGNYIQQRLHV